MNELAVEKRAQILGMMVENRADGGCDSEHALKAVSAVASRSRAMDIAHLSAVERRSAITLRAATFRRFSEVWP